MRYPLRLSIASLSIVSLVLAVALPGCSPGTRALGWEFEFASPALASRAQRVVGRIHAGGCSGTSVLYEDEVGRGESPSMPVNSMSVHLAPGVYGFEGVALDGDCIAFASGCVETEVPRGEGDVVLVRLEAATESSMCSAAMCNAGHCGPLDAGRLDAGALDAPPSDAGPRSDVPLDVPGDAGSDSGVDASVPRSVSSVGVGRAFACAITNDGALFCWGSNLAGQLGQGTIGGSTDRNRPTRVGTGSTWTGLGFGDEHVCGTLGTDLYCWGDNMDGQLVTSDHTSRGTPTRAGTIVGPFVRIDGATVGDHTCTLRSGGSLGCVGQNDYGQLGLGDNVEHLAFGTWTGNWTAVAAGHHFTCGIRSDGALLCTGGNEAGQLGTGTLGTDVNVPTLVGTDLDWQAIDTGDTHACGVRGSTGELWCWGNGTGGRLGNGVAMGSDVPIRIGTATGWTAVSTGGTHSCALRGEGELWCWGENTFGQVGNATGGAPVLSPRRVGSDSDWGTVVTGSSFTCGTRGRTLYCWGSNGSGQLGQGDSTPRSTPTLVLFP